MDFLEKYKNPIYYLGLFAVTLWPFVNFCASSTNIAQIPYLEFSIVFFVVFMIVLIFCEIIKRIFKIAPIKILMIYSFIYVAFLYYFLYTPYIRAFFEVSGVSTLFNFVMFLSLLTLMALALFFSKYKNFQLAFLSFVGAVFLFSIVEFLCVKISKMKFSRHVISSDSIAYEFKTKPNIYFLLLDAYPRHDTLLSERDNSSFIEFFKKEEFIVADKSYSNYASTWPSLSATFQMSYLQEGDIVENDVLSPLKEVFIVLKKNNYKIVVVPTYLSAFNGRNVADVIITKHRIWSFLYEALSTYLSKSFFKNYISKLLSPYAYFSLNEIKQVVSMEKGKPLFTFIHFLQFHDYAFNREHEIVKPHGKDVKFQSVCFEKFVENAISQIVSHDPNAIIIAQADHGPWYFQWSPSDDPDRFDRGFGIFSAFRLPKLHLTDDVKNYLQDSPSPVNNFRLIFALLAEKKPDFLPFRAFITEPSGKTSSEFVSIEERIDLEKFLDKLDDSTLFHSLGNLAHKISNEQIVRSILENNGYKNWDKLYFSNRQWVTAEIVSEAAMVTLKELIAEQDYSDAYRSLRDSGNSASDEEIVKFLVESNGYKNWDKLTPINQKWAVAEIVSQAERMHFEKLLAEQDYSLNYSLARDSGTYNSDEMIVELLFKKNGYENWNKLSLSSREWVIAEIVSQAQRTGLEEFLAKHNYFDAYRSMRNSGNKASEEKLVKSLLESNGYKNWDKLSSSNRKWVVSKIMSKAEMTTLEKFLARHDYSATYLMVQDSRNREIIKSFLESSGYKNWDKLSSVSQKWAVAEVMERVEKASLAKFLTKQDFPAAYYAIRSSGNDESDEKVVRFLLESNGYKSWGELSFVNRLWAISEIVSKAIRKDLEKILAEQDYSGAYRSMRRSGEDASDEEIVKFLLESNVLFESNGYLSWSELSVASRKWVVAEIVSKAERMDLEEFLAEHDYSAAYRSIRNSKDDVSDEVIVKYFLERDGYKNWDILSSVNRKWVVDEIVSKAERMNLEKFLAKRDYSVAYRSIRDSKEDVSDETIVKSLLERDCYKKWNKLSSFSQERIVALIVSKAEKIDLEKRLAEQDYALAYRSVKDSGDKNPPEVVVKFLLESNGYKGWSKLSSTDRKWVVARITLGAEGAEL